MGTIPCDHFHPLDPTEFSDESHAVIDFISDYYRSIEKYPVRSQVEPGYLTKLIPKQAPQLSEPIGTILTDIKHDILPGLTHWQSPNFYAYFQANASTAGFLGEMLCSGLNVIGFNWISSPAATELESIVMDWMGKLLKLPNSFLFSGEQGGGGILHGSTCEAVICTLVAARDHALQERGYDAITKLVVYASDQAHSTVQKAVKIVGIPPSNFRVIKTFASEGYAMKPSDLEDVLKDDVAKGFVPVYLVATVGTTGVGTIDSIRELGKLANEFGVWYHIDAAYGGSAVICPEFRHYFDGVELADSVSMNPHKWFLTNMDCCCLWIKKAKLLVDSLSTNPEFLRNQASETNEVVDYKDWQIALSRRFKAIKLWLVMRRFGVDNLVKHIRNDITMAKQFEKMVRMDNRFEVVVPRKFALICFRLKPKFGEDKDANGDNEKLLEMVNSSGKAFMTHVKVDGMFVLRFAVGTTLTEMTHVKATWKLIQDKATEYLEKQIIKE